jgi:lipopolysaccharide/colanic/teichoic acid biosynthesis glycosyltransferase
MIVGIESECQANQAAVSGAPPWAVDPGNAHGYLAYKSIVDTILAVVLFILTLPFMIVAMLLMKLTSRGPAIYCQTRVGLHGRLFTIYKIRTMVQDSERLSGPQWSLPGDPRVTPVGRFLRATHLDELPQLWNVLRGEMSLVGPRPERPEFVAQFERAIPCYRDRLLVRPGVTGLAQVQLPPDTDLNSVCSKLACDLYYVQRVGAWLDLRIILSTASAVVGIPFAVPRTLLRIPSGSAVDAAYRDHSAKAKPVFQMQSA